MFDPELKQFRGKYRDEAVSRGPGKPHPWRNPLTVIIEAAAKICERSRSIG